MISIKKVSKGKCIDCGKKASKEIDSQLYCPQCGDTLLIIFIGKCIKGVEDATIKISIMPKR
jgi:predicted RNA-binding Zn-ribbon protein involved in translation (DUF1610 family)